MTAAPYRKKLIEVALPLAEINAAAAKEKSIRHGHPSTLHLWWARRPLAACRAVLFASLVDDPSADPAFADRSETEQAIERERLHDLIKELVRWENSNNEEVLARARAEIRRCCGDDPPPVLDPFCGGGSIPLEAQRLGLEARGSDLNPVAVLITKALIEIPPRFAGRKPVHPEARRQLRTWKGAEGLAADVRAYGAWMRAEAERRIGHLYPKVTLPKEQGGGEATVIAWLWARTVTCPNPACGAAMPLVSTFKLSTKKGKETWVEPVAEPGAKRVRFEVRSGKGTPPEPPKVGRGAQFRCLVCGNVARDAHIKAEGMAGRMGAQLMAVVAEGRRSRVYVAPDAEQERIAASARPEWRPEQAMPDNPRWFSPPIYGLTTFGDLFTDRQLAALTTFSDLVGEARQRAQADARAAGLPDDGAPLAEGGCGAQAYADAVATYLGFLVSKLADKGSTICTWDVGPTSSRTASGRSARVATVRVTFSRQALPMTWDFAEVNFFSDSVGSIDTVLATLTAPLDYLPSNVQPGAANQMDATQSPIASSRDVLVSTDPPYYDNIGYADLSDFFYVWLRRSLQSAFPSLFRTMLVPKNDELIASPYRHDGNKGAAERYFEAGLTDVFQVVRDGSDPDYPTTIYYAFKQRETAGSDGTGNGAVASTGWETMLEGLVNSGLSIHATWPLRTELSNRSIASGTNALASSIVLACRPRPEDAPIASRNDFIRALKRELPAALRLLQHGAIPPVDLAQAAIGPGMAICSRYRQVREPSGDRLSVRTALALINQALDEILTEQEGDYDRETRFAIRWLDAHGMRQGPYDDAEKLVTALGLSVRGLQEAGLFRAVGGKAWLLGRDEMPADWNPATDNRPTVWEVAQHLVRALDGGGHEAAARLLRQTGPLADAARDLAYRLYDICERKGWAQEAQAYNSLVVAWPEIAHLANELRDEARVQSSLL